MAGIYITYVTDMQLLKLSNIISGDSYNSLGTELRINHNEYRNILTRHMMNYSEAFLEILHKWKDRDGGPVEELDKALRQADCGGLVSQYKAAE